MFDEVTLLQYRNWAHVSITFKIVRVIDRFYYYILFCYRYWTFLYIDVELQRKTSLNMYE